MLQELPPNAPSGISIREVTTWLVTISSFILGSGFIGKFLIKKLEISDKGEEREQTLEFQKMQYIDQRTQGHIAIQDKQLDESSEKIKNLEVKVDSLIERQFKSMEQREELKLQIHRHEALLDLRTAEAKDLADKFNKCEERSAKIEKDNTLMRVRIGDLKEDNENTRRLLAMERERRILNEAELIRHGLLHPKGPGPLTPPPSPPVGNEDE